MKKTVLSKILNRDNWNLMPDNMIINGGECSTDKQAIAEHFK